MWIGITLGDVTGIGPEVTLKALAALPDDGARFLLLGDPAAAYAANRPLNLPLVTFRGFHSTARFSLLPPTPNVLPASLACGDPAAAQAALASLRLGAQHCLCGDLAGLVTAPVSKEAILRSGTPFVGQTEFLSEIAGTSRTIMMLLGADDRHRWLRVALVTTHLPIRLVADAITQPKVELAIELAAQACADLALPRARIGVCGLNPHAGEGGRMGSEDLDVVAPAVVSARQRGLDAAGPFAADTLFHYAYRGDYDAVVAMYHDQGLAPLKTIGFETGINWTLGLPFIRTSPDHGTAYDIAGRNQANPSSMLSAIQLTLRLARQRPPRVG